MRIGIDTTALSRNTTGTGCYINCLLDQLKNTTNEIKTFDSVNFVKNENSFEAFRKIKSLHGGVKRQLYRKLKLSANMIKEDVDCAFFPNYFMPPQFEKPAAIVIHDLSFITHPQFYSKTFVLYYQRQMKETLKKRPIVITVSNHSRDSIHKNLGIKKDNIYLVQAYSQFNKNQLNIYTGKSKTPYFLFVGHVEPRKNLSFLVDNFILWKEKRKLNFKIVITGEIWIRSSSTINFIKKYKDHPDVELTGYVDEIRLQNLYANASGFVHTSFVEGFGFPVLEAMHYSLPIICSTGTATEEISGTNSIAVDPYDNNSLQNGFDKLYEKVLIAERINYDIKYSPELMRAQLNKILDLIELKQKSKVIFSSSSSHSVEEAVEKTLVYARLFNSGIKKEFLPKYLFDVKISDNVLKLALEKLLNENKIFVKNNSFYLNAFSKNFYVKKKAIPNHKRSIKFLELLKKFSLISSIAFSGGTANYGLENHDDIDLFIITKPNCVFIVYSFIHFSSILLGLRKVICANYLIDEKNLEIKSPRDFYTAHQIIFLIAYKNQNILDRFVFQNRWVNYFFPNFPVETVHAPISSRLYLVFSPLNKMIMIFYKLFYWKLISKNISSESLKIAPSCLKLHTNDHREKITKMFNEEWNKYLNAKFSKRIKVLKIRNEIATTMDNPERLLTETKTKFPV